MELAFTLAKNATKPNPFEIISLQTTRKENWKTEETLARAVVTLQTERIKKSNPYVYDDDDKALLQPGLEPPTFFHVALDSLRGQSI